MGLMVSGEVLGVERREVRPRSGADPFEQRTLHVLSGIDKYELRAARDFVLLPGQGELVTLEVAVSGFRRGDGGVGIQLTALGLAPSDAPSRSA